jgi:hypothetical protein
MKRSILLIFMALSLMASGQKLPEGVNKSSTPCNLAKGFTLDIYNKDNNMIAKIEPSGCSYSNTDGPQPAPVFQTDFYPTAGSKSFKTNDEAVKWLMAEMDKYYKPIVVTKWQKLDNTTPKISLKYPEEWTFRADKDDYFAKPAGPANNKIVLILTQPNGSNEIIQIIRTPNTGKVNTQKFMENSSRINGAIDFKKNPPKDQLIGGKTFKTLENTFALVMLQRHYWYADDKEVIYIGYGLLKDDRIRYPQVVADIIKSITW